jgi:formylglycine-generating enzyme required for sulfatase activity
VFVADFYLQPEASGRNPVNKGDSTESYKPRVLRGGSFEGVASYLRSADRYFEKPERRWRGFGLRPIWQVSVQE